MLVKGLSALGGNLISNVNLSSDLTPAGELAGNNVPSLVLDPNGQLGADLSTAAAASIN